MLKDVILVGAGMVITAATFRGGRLVRDDLPPGSHATADTPSLDGEQKLRLLLESAGDRDSSAAVCERPGISEAEMHHWRRSLALAPRRRSRRRPGDRFRRPEYPQGESNPRYGRERPAC